MYLCKVLHDHLKWDRHPFILNFGHYLLSLSPSLPPSLPQCTKSRWWKKANWWSYNRLPLKGIHSNPSQLDKTSSASVVSSFFPPPPPPLPLFLSLFFLLSSQIRFGKDFEQQLSFYVEARASFSNIDSVLVFLIQVSILNLLSLPAH